MPKRSNLAITKIVFSLLFQFNAFHCILSHTPKNTDGILLLRREKKLKIYIYNFWEYAKLLICNTRVEEPNDIL